MDTQTTALYNTLLAGLIFTTTLLVVFVLSVVRNYRNRIEENNRQLEREIESIDSERERIAADLHDELGTGLSAVGLFIQQAGDTGSFDILEKATSQLRHEQAKIKEIAFDLAPRIMQTEGLTAALNDLFTSVKVLNRYKLVVKGMLEDKGFVAAKSVHLYRILREILTNILKHAVATEITIEFSADMHHLFILVIDNGKGFEINASASTGRGLLNIQSRSHLLNATVSVNSIVEKGTTIKLKIPKCSMLAL